MADGTQIFDFGIPYISGKEKVRYFKNLVHASTMWSNYDGCINQVKGDVTQFTRPVHIFMAPVKWLMYRVQISRV